MRRFGFIATSGCRIFPDPVHSIPFLYTSLALATRTVLVLQLLHPFHPSQGFDSPRWLPPFRLRRDSEAMPPTWTLDSHQLPPTGKASITPLRPPSRGTQTIPAAVAPMAKYRLGSAHSAQAVALVQSMFPGSHGR